MEEICVIVILRRQLVQHLFLDQFFKFQFVERQFLQQR